MLCHIDKLVLDVLIGEYFVWPLSAPPTRGGGGGGWGFFHFNLQSQAGYHLRPKKKACYNFFAASTDKKSHENMLEVTR